MRRNARNRTRLDAVKCLLSNNAELPLMLLGRLKYLFKLKVTQAEFTAKF